MNKVAVVTGGSSGIGLATAKTLCDAGYTVYELSRSERFIPGITHITADITDMASLKSAFAEIEQKEDNITLLVNNAGMGISGPTEFNTADEIKKILDVNLVGMINTTQIALPLLRKAKTAKIINISSVAAVFPIPYQSMYSATKSAVNALTYALRNELSAHGIRVCAVLPGDVKTGFTDARKKSVLQNELYTNADSAVKRMETDEQNGMPPTKVAKAVLKAATRKNPRIFWVVGSKYRVFCLLSKVLPASLCCKIVGALYK